MTSGDDFVKGVSIKTDRSGNIIVSGNYLKNLTIQDTTITNHIREFFIAKFDPAGNLLWVNSYDVNGFNVYLTLDSNDNIYLTGDFGYFAVFGDDTLYTKGSNPPNYIHGDQDIYVCKLSPEGKLQWVNQIGGILQDFSFGIDATNNEVYVTGWVRGASAVIGDTLINSQNNGEYFLAKYSAANGQFQWARSITTTTGSYGRSVKIDKENNIVVAGIYSGNVNFGNSVFLSGGRMFIAKYTSQGTAIWARRATNADPYDIAIDSLNNYYVCGSYLGTADFEGQTRSGNVGNEIFILKCTPLGVFQIVRSFTAPGSAIGKSVKITANEIYLSGEFNGQLTLGDSTYNYSNASNKSSYLTALSYSNLYPIWSKKIQSTKSILITDIVPKGEAVYIIANFSGVLQTQNKTTAPDTTNMNWNSNAILLEVSPMNIAFTLPEITTSSITSIDKADASGGGVITGGSNIISQKGICWSEVSPPTINDSKTTEGSGSGAFNSSLSGLQEKTTYFVRAYAVNSRGIFYGNEVSFTTLFDATIPTILTDAISNIDFTSCTAGGTITDDGGESVQQRGVCWSTSPIPTLADNSTTNGTGTGTFSASITGLLSNTTYYLRAYATNNTGTAYGNEVSFTTLSFTTPTILTDAISNLDFTSCTAGGTITDDGGESVQQRGVCWSTSPIPTLADNSTTNGTGTGAFSASITGLLSNTTYYLRAYATNNIGTAYGNEVMITTLLFTGAKGISNNHSIRIFPNPAIDFLNIFTDLPNQYLELIIFDLAGNVVYSDNTKKECVSINISFLAKGFYILEIQNGSYSWREKFLVD